MTNNQIAFWTLEHDKAKTAVAQRETERSNRAREDETARSNLAKEAETYRSNLARETETKRSNIASETETNRANLEREAQGRTKLVEDKRHNYAQEYNKKLETDTKAWGPILGTIIAGTGAKATEAQSAVEEQKWKYDHSVIGKSSKKKREKIENQDRAKKNRSRGSR